MSPLAFSARIFRRARALLRRDVVERDLDDEIRFHLEMETRKLERGGLSPEEAARTARVEGKLPSMIRPASSLTSAAKCTAMAAPSEWP